MATGGSTLHGVTDDQKRWLVFGIALNKVLVTLIRPFVEQEVQKEYGNLQTSHSIHTQSTSGRLKNWPTFLKYENINGNDVFPRLGGGRYDYSKFDCRVTSHVDFAKLYLENYMAKFNAFADSDASAVLALLGRVPVFSPAVQSGANDVRQARNAWAHCVFGDWNPVNYHQRFNEMEQLVKTLGLPPANERNLLEELKEWESKGTILCMNATVDPDLLKLVQQHVNTLKTDVELLTFEVQEDKERVSQALKDISTSLEELEARVVTVEHKQAVIKIEQSSLSKTVDALQSSVDTRVANVEHQQKVMKKEQSSLSKTVDALQSSVDTRVVSVQREQEFMKRKHSDVDTRVTNVEHQQKVMKQEKCSLSKTVDALQSSVDTRVVGVQREQEVLKEKQSDVDTRVANVEHDQEVMKQDQSSLSDKMKDVQQRVAGVEDKLSSSTLQENRGDRSCSYGGSANVVSQQDLSSVSVEIASCESDIAFFAQRHDSDTRQWFFDDFNEWFHNPGDSRAYVLLGDPGVGKSVLAGVIAQRMTKAGQLGAAYFCRHNDGTRNDPRYLLGTVACQLCNCNTQYKDFIRGERGVKMLLDNSKLGVRELFTKLLQEPLSKCSPCDQRKLVIIDALDETEYESREDFLDLIMHRFPLLPEWLVFFITSRPEDSVRFRLKKYNPCVKICAGNSDQDNFYQQHEQDIQTFFKKRIDFSRLTVTIEDISKTCNGLFLYAHYIVEELKISADSGKELNHLSDLFPGDIDSFFLQNFKRVYNQVGQDIFNKLFGCAIVSPAPLPVSIIPYMLTREKSNCDEQQVIDAISQFVVLRVSDQTLTFLHNLIPSWLTDKNKASRKLFIDKKIAGEYLRRVFVEILPFVVNEPLTGPCIDDELKDYVLRLGIRFLCEMGDKNSLKVAYDSLTNYQFIERRMTYGRIDIYRLLKDFRILVRHPSLEVTKREILQEIVFSIESNVLVLLECPHLLHSCLRNASNAVQNTISIPQVSAPGLYISVCRLPDDTLADIRCSTASASKGIVAGAKNRSVLFFDACLLEKLSGPFDLSGAIDNINHLEFTPDGKYLFFGRLDKWFSVERGCVQDFPHFSGNSHVYQWGVFAHDEKSIVVKRSLLSYPRTCEGDCLSYLLVLWALEEIKQSRDDSDVMCHKQAERIGRLWNRLVRTIYQTRDVPDHDDRFCYCCSRLIELLQPNQEPSLETVRQLIIELYHFIFKYQVWDLETGTPVLQQAFSKGIQLSPFAYFCHVFCAFSDLGIGTCCSGTEKGRSICNIAVWCALGQLKSFDFEYLSLWGSFSEKLLGLYDSSERGMKKRSPWELTSEKQFSFKLLEVLLNLLWLVERTYLEQKSKVEEEERKSELERTTSCKDVEEFLKKKERLPWELMLEKELSFELLEDLHNLLWLVERKYLEQKSKVEEEERKSELERTTSCKDVEEFLKKKKERLPWELMLEKELSFELLEDLHNLLWLAKRKYSEQKWKVEEEERKSELEGTISCKDVKELLKKMEERLRWVLMLEKELSFELLGDLRNLLWFVKRKYLIEKWKVEEEERKSELERTTSCKDVEEFLLLQATNMKQAKFIAERKMINKFTYSTITKDCLYFVYSHEGSLHAKSLETGAVFTSVSGLNLHYFVKEKRVGYLFRCAAEEKAIVLTNLSSPFKFLVMSPSVVKPIALMFLSIDSVMSVSSDSRLMLWQTTTFADKEIFTCVSEFLLTASSLHVKNCVLSTDGSLIAIHQETKVKLYSFAKSELKLLHSVRCEFAAVTHFAFSADSTALLFYTKDSETYSHFHAWDIKKEVSSPSFKFVGLKTADCCYLQWNNLVLCFDYEIEIWEYTGHTCVLLTRLAVEKPYNSVLFNLCTMSEDKQFLACCIVDVILVYRLNVSNIHSSKQVLRGHLGRIEFCRFLKINRYLLSYGIDGMIFLWDIDESKAVAYTRMAEGKENIASMAVSPEEDRIVCFMTSGRVHMIKLSRLGAALPAETSLQLQGDVALHSQIRILSTEDDLSEATNSSDSEEDADTSDCGYLYESD